MLLADGLCVLECRRASLKYISPMARTMLSLALITVAAAWSPASRNRATMSSIMSLTVHTRFLERFARRVFDGFLKGLSHQLLHIRFLQAKLLRLNMHPWGCNLAKRCKAVSVSRHTSELIWSLPWDTHRRIQLCGLSHNVVSKHDYISCVRSVHGFD